MFQFKNLKNKKINPLKRQIKKLKRFRTMRGGKKMHLTVEQFRTKYLKGREPVKAVMTAQEFATLSGLSARWGEMAVFTVEEMMDADFHKNDLKGKVPVPVPVVPVPVPVPMEEGEMSEEEGDPVRVTQIEVAIVDEDVSPQIWRPEAHGYCLYCDYKVHSDPPAHMNAQQKKHCCGWCQVSLGRGHGPNCQRCF
jgi:hypothetical protein